MVLKFVSEHTKVLKRMENNRSSWDVVNLCLKQHLEYGKYLLIFIAVSACEDPSTIGEDFIIKEPINLYYLDTVSVELSTVQIDSIVTSGTGDLICGYHEDERLGNIKATGFFQVGLDSINSSAYPGTLAYYESIVLRLQYDDYSYYDTTEEVSLSVYQLAEEIVLNEDTDYLYNTSNFSLLEDDLDTIATIGKSTFFPYPNLRDYVDIPLDEWLGRELFQMVKDEDDILEEIDEFLEKYPGFALVADQKNGSILRFSTSSRIIVNYVEGGEKKKLVFPINDLYHFSRIVSNRQQTSLADLKDSRNAISSTLTNNEAYLQAGVGLGIRVAFPHLDKMKEVESKDILTQAHLTLGVVKNSYSNNRPLPDTLIIYVVDALNRVLDEYSTEISLENDREFGEETRYNILITSFIESRLGLIEDNENALLIFLPEESYNSTVDRLVIGNRQNEYESLLKLYLLNYETAY